MEAVIIEDEYLINLYKKGRSEGKPMFSLEVERGFIKRIIQISNVANTNDLRNIKSLHFEKLSGKLDGKYSIRVNIGYRIERDGNNNRLEIICIEELNNHYS